MRTLQIHTDAAAEAEEAAAVRWHEGKRKELEREFERALTVAFDLLAAEVLPSAPIPGSARERGIRRVILKRFPYDVVFAEHSDHLYVLAVAHHARRPGFWRNR